MRVSPHPTPPTLAPGRRWAVLGIVLGALASVLCFGPARWLAAGLAPLTRGHLQLQQARGSWWNGSAELLLTGGPDSQDRVALPGRVHWRLGLDGLGLAVALQADCCTSAPLRLRAHPSLGQWRLALDTPPSHWPASLLAGLGTPWNTVQAQGQLRLDSEHLGAQWADGRWRVEGAARLEARELSSRLSTLRPLGSYRLTLQGGDVPQLRLETLEGALRLSGQGQWVGARLRFEGVAEATPERESALANFLNIIGRRQGARALITLG